MSDDKICFIVVILTEKKNAFFKKSDVGKS